MNIGLQKATEIKKKNSKEENIVFFHGSFLFPSKGPLFSPLFCYHAINLSVNRGGTKGLRLFNFKLVLPKQRY